MSSSSQLLTDVGRLEITTRRLVEGLVSGSYNSVFHGRGIEFNEICEYHYGDDIRAIDWNVTARFDHPYIKEFIEERDLQVYVIVDISGSGNFGKNSPKRKRINEITAALLLSAQRSGDRVGMILTSNKIEEFIPARKGRRHVMRSLARLVSCKPDSTLTNLEVCIGNIERIVKRRSLIILVSDLIDESDYGRPLRHLSRHHDVMIIRVFDPHEREIPNVGPIQLEDGETGEQILVDTSDESFRNAYSKIIARKDSYISRIIGQCRIDTIAINSDSTYERALLHFFKVRSRGGRTHGRI